MSNTTYNLDDQDSYVPFQFMGNEYRFYYPTLEQSLQVDALAKGEDDNKAMEFMFSLIKKPDGATYPDFETVRPKMTLKQTMVFRQMLETELGFETK